MVKVWIEKTIIKERPQTDGLGLGASLWSPAKANGGGDIYSNMRIIKKDDIIFHLVDNKTFAGVSIVDSEYKKFTCPPGKWEGRDGYLIPLRTFVDFRKTHEELDRKDILNERNRALLLRIQDERNSKLFFDKYLDLNQGAYITPAPYDLVNLIKKEFFQKNGKYPPHIDDYSTTPETTQMQETNSVDSEGVQMQETNKKSEDFIDYLRKEGLSYDVKTVENFLLSIKVKPFVILTGGTGTGKTKLAQTYGKYVSNAQPKHRVVCTEVPVGKSDTNGGWTISQKDFISAVPEAGKFNGEYTIKVDGEKGVGRLSMAPRVFFERDGKIKEHMEKLKTEGKKERVEFELYLGDSSKSASETDRYEIIPVGSNWNENRHIIGFDNIILKEYSSTPALELMLRAEQDPASPFLMILDEMNLSHVERYFSDLLSAMESGERIVLHSNAEYDEVPLSIAMPSNLTIIGTVNMDETTYMFSPKVLDRANVIEFRAVGLNEYINKRDQNNLTGDVDFLQDPMKGSEVRGMKAPEIVSFLREKRIDVNQITESLEFFQSSLSKINLSFSFRTIDEIMRFMYVSYLYDTKNFKSNWNRYLDAQIMQKILPKIHGNKSIENTLIELLDHCNKRIPGSDEYLFPESRSKIERMIELLKTQRYVSFTS